MKPSYIILTTVIVSAALANAKPRQKWIFENGDFEIGTMKNWTTIGKAFDIQPTRDDNLKARQAGESKHQGKYWIGSAEAYSGKKGKAGDSLGDSATGSLYSMYFTINKKYLCFRVGGSASEKVGVSLLYGNEERFLARGVGPEEMAQVSIDVSDLLSRKVQLKIYDKDKDGHINVDEFLRSEDLLGVKPENRQPESK